MTTDLPGLPKLYTEQELAEYLEIELHTVRRLRKCGKLRYTRAGVSPRFTAEHVKEYLEAEEQSCRNNTRDSTKSVSSGSCRPTRNTGTMESRGTTNPLDKHAALALSAQILKAQKPPSTNTR